MNLKKIKDASMESHIADILFTGEYTMGNTNDQTNLANKCNISLADFEPFFKNLSAVVPKGTPLVYTFGNYADKDSIFQAPIGNYVLSFKYK